jgi:hypothetical protein
LTIEKKGRKSRELFSSVNKGASDALKERCIMDDKIVKLWCACKKCKNNGCNFSNREDNACNLKYISLNSDGECFEKEIR